MKTLGIVLCVLAMLAFPALAVVGIALAALAGVGAAIQKALNG